MKVIDQITAAIDITIAARKEQLPVITVERNRVSQQLAALEGLQRQLDGLLDAGADDAVAAEVEGAKGELALFCDELSGYRASLDELEAEFTRDTLNIGVSGAARTGKSTTLQRITGLTDRQIPSGDLNPVTAVRSEIYNSSRNEAVITFKTESSFIEGYVRPHVANVNEYLDENSKLSIGSLAALKACELPEKLDGSVSTAATDSLKRLREAKRSVGSFERFLGNAPATVTVDDASRYITYPAAGVERAEAEGGSAADRRYLAVELAQIYCQFPNLGDAKVGLVDLPGLGEIGNSASEVHLKGLEDKVDQIFMVMKPSKEKAFANSEIACNLDQLQVIQPAVRRGDLIVAAINKDVAVGQEAADNLRAHFEAEINAGREDKYSVEEYCAVDEGSVSEFFAGLLDRLGTLLPEMDRQKVAYCMGAVDLSDRIAVAAAQIVASMDRVLRKIPSSDRVMKQRIDAIERAIIGHLSAYAVELGEEARADSDVFKAFIADAQGIHDDVAAHIADGLFRADAGEWLELTSSSKDYYNLYRDECKRIRYEIIDAYCGLDRFYGVHVSNFKLRVLDTLLRSCGMDHYFGFGPLVSADGRILKVASELGSTLRDDDLDSALSLLAGVKFDFRSNVFLQIEGHLSELANPSEEYALKKGYNSNKVNKRVVLGGSSSCGNKQEKLAEYLRHDATVANDAILEALKGEKDRFNKYLAVSIDFFNNYLFGKDEDNFKQVVIRGLIREYKDWVLPDADDASKSPLGRMAREVKESALALAGGHRVPAPVVTTSRTQVAPSNGSIPSSKAACAGSYAIGETLIGTVNRVESFGAFVTLDKGYGIVLTENLAGDEGDNAHDYVKRGQSVTVEVIGFDSDRGRYDLSLEKCA